jgi:pimeloyl-ACP methyl ester carboxylesterase
MTENMSNGSLERLSVGETEVLVEGRGETTLLMVHGWPDTYRLWDGQVDRLKADHRSARFTLPGFAVGDARRLRTLAEIIGVFEAVVDVVSPDRPVTLVLHDWGCFYGYQYYMKNPERVSRIVGLDVGDVGSKEMKLPLSMVLFTLGYQLWLVGAWVIGGRTGDVMTRLMAHALGVRADPSLIHSGMNYAYYLMYRSALLRRSQGDVPFEPACPMLFLYGRKKRTMFHSDAFVERLNRTPMSRAVGFDASHWLMLEQPDEVASEIREWMRASPYEGAFQLVSTPAEDCRVNAG